MHRLEIKAENDLLVSVIMPVYNGEKYVAQALDSAFEQDFRSFEVIFVDDGSTDRTREIIERYRNVNYTYQSNQGVLGPRYPGDAVTHLINTGTSFFIKDKGREEKGFQVQSGNRAVNMPHFTK